MTKKATIRKDILSKGLSVPVGEGYYGSKKALPYRWIGDDFQVLLKGKWNEAYSIDFEF